MKTVYINGNTELLIDREDTDNMDEEVAIEMVEAAIKMLNDRRIETVVDCDYSAWRGGKYNKSAYIVGNRICTFDNSPKWLRRLIASANYAMLEVLYDAVYDVTNDFD